MRDRWERVRLFRSNQGRLTQAGIRIAIYTHRRVAALARNMRLCELSGNRRRTGGFKNHELVVGAEWTAAEIEKTNIRTGLISRRPKLVVGVERAMARRLKKPTFL